MIEYNRGGVWACLNLFQMRGSVFPLSFVVAAPCAIITAFMKWFNLIEEQDVLLNNTAWSGFSFLVGFLVVFRTSQAYSRFWDGATSTHRMRAEWCDAASAITAFTKHSKADAQRTSRFLNTLIRLFSLMHAMALGELGGETTEDAPFRFLELIDNVALDSQSWRALQNTDYKVAMVFQWIQAHIVDNISTGVLSIPPPILSRAFQELANGMVAHHEAMKISEVPFPFPYAQACDCLLIMHWLMTPFITVQYTANVYSAAVFSLVQVFILWSLTNIAVEIEHPFGNDANDLNSTHMQHDMNVHLLLLLNQAAQRVPILTEEAVMGEILSIETHEENQKRGAMKNYDQICRIWDARGVPQRHSIVLEETKEKKTEMAPPDQKMIEAPVAVAPGTAPKDVIEAVDPSPPAPAPPPLFSAPSASDALAPYANIVGAVSTAVPVTLATTLPDGIGHSSSSCSSTTASPIPARPEAFPKAFASFTSAAEPSTAQDHFVHQLPEVTLHIDKDTQISFSHPPRVSMVSAQAPKKLSGQFGGAMRACDFSLDADSASGGRAAAQPSFVTLAPDSLQAVVATAKATVNFASQDDSRSGSKGMASNSGSKEDLQDRPACTKLPELPESLPELPKSLAREHTETQHQYGSDTVAVSSIVQFETETMNGSCFSCVAPPQPSVQALS